MIGRKVRIVEAGWDYCLSCEVYPDDVYVGHEGIITYEEDDHFCVLLDNGKDYDVKRTHVILLDD